MGKIIKFPGNNDNQNENEVVPEKEEKLQKTSEDKLTKAIEDYILSTFAVRDIIFMDYIHKENKSNIGFVGVLAYEHKRREGVFGANFIGEAIKDKNGNVRIIEIAFEAGEPSLYKQIMNTLKAKNILPVINT